MSFSTNTEIKASPITIEGIVQFLKFGLVRNLPIVRLLVTSPINQRSIFNLYSVINLLCIIFWLWCTDKVITSMVIWSLNYFAFDICSHIDIILSICLR